MATKTIPPIPAPPPPPLSERIKTRANQWLLTGEVALLLGLLMEYGQGWMDGSSLPGVAKTLIVMVINIGLVSCLMSAVEWLMGKTLGGLFKAFPAADFMLHAVIYMMLFVVYANTYEYLKTPEITEVVPASEVQE